MTRAQIKEQADASLEIISIGSLYSGLWDKKYWSSSRVRFLFIFSMYLLIYLSVIDFMYRGDNVEVVDDICLCLFNHLFISSRCEHVVLVT